MAVFVALLRAINVGGTGKLPMTELRALCETCGFKNAKTYIQSGNVVFESRLAEEKVRTKLERALAEQLGKPVGVALRSQAELEAVLSHNPFKEQAPNRVIVFFLNDVVPKTALRTVVAPSGEQLKAHGREIYVYYPEGQGPSKLKLPQAAQATGRNINTIVKMAALAAELH